MGGMDAYPCDICGYLIYDDGKCFKCELDIHYLSKDEIKNVVKQLLSINPKHYSLEDIKKCGIDNFSQDMAEEVVRELICDGEVILGDNGKMELVEEL